MKKIICSALLLLAFVPSVFAAGHMDAAHTERHEIRSVTDGHGESSMLPSILVNEVDAASGIKAGDIMVSVNGKKAVDYEEEFNCTGLRDIFSAEAVEYEIMRDGKIAKYSVVPAFISPEEFQKQFATKN